ncbi:hypothetical protein [Xanthomonas sp. NCPPB 1128]|uniref:hypothetical protein n=1 Tax=Xanthomonas sp. NCPPB 1128 TaxID=1775876 RepID=UPI000B0D68B8|nr:hypothetical protein [Xanthomonas sp. NCPPB 1128]
MELLRRQTPHNVTTLVRIGGNWFAVRWVRGKLVMRKLASARGGVSGSRYAIDR